MSDSKPSGVQAPIRVFISYAHDNEEHKAVVLLLWRFLRKVGVDARLDHSAAQEQQDWPTWMIREVRSARFVLVIASPEYVRRAEGGVAPGTGRGVLFEASLLRNEVYLSREAALGRFLPVVLPGRSREEIPIWLGQGAYSYYSVTSFTEKGAAELLQVIRGSGIGGPLIGTAPTSRRAGVSSAANLASLIQRIAARDSRRNEGMLQADVRQLLLLGRIGLEEWELGVDLAEGSGYQQKITIERARAVVDVRSDLRVPGVRSSAEGELLSYCRGRGRSRGQHDHRIGILTDGTEWRLYLCTDAEVQLVSDFVVDRSTRPGAILSWLESALCTASGINPSPSEILGRLGAGSTFYALSTAWARSIFECCRASPGVQIRRQLWSRLLRTAQGTNFSDEDSLFVDHTLLVAMAKVVGHAVLEYSLEEATIGASEIMSGVKFSEAQIGGAVEADFFDWIAEAPGGNELIRSLVRSLTRFSWDQVEHDVMKVLYESIIRPEIRHHLGEYYTPDWLAEEITRTCIEDPLNQRVLDPSCGSGTFLFHAVRQFLAAADAAGQDASATVPALVDHVIGIDVNPVAVTLARVTYLLAVGQSRLRARTRPSLEIPVYLGDSLRWGQEGGLWSFEGLSVRARDDGEFADADLDARDRLEFPDELVVDVRKFDPLVTEFARLATERRRGCRVPSLSAIFRRFSVPLEHQATLERTFEVMCNLHDQERDHIWGYYVRNLARPLWLAKPGNQADVLVGNPPWLAFRFMTPTQQESFRRMSLARGLWAGASVATNQDLSGLFVARCIELYLRPGGKFGCVMPFSVLSRRQFAGFRRGLYEMPLETVKVAFDRSWDLKGVKPTFFPVPASVVFGSRLDMSMSVRPLTDVPEVWSGNLPIVNASRAQIQGRINRSVGERSGGGSGKGSIYASAFFQGATVVPRVLFLVKPGPANPLGSGAGRRVVESWRSPNEKRPWKEASSLRCVLEEQFIRPLYKGDSILPYRCLAPVEAVIPWDGRQLLSVEDEMLDLHQGLAKWWREANEVWVALRSSDRLALHDRLNYQRGLTRQFPAPRYRVVYAKSGMYMAAAIVADAQAVIDHELYWGGASLDEARYLIAVLNSDTLTMAVRPLQARGEHNPRHFDKYVWSLPIPRFDSSDVDHRTLVSLAVEAEVTAAGLALPRVRFESQRRLVREMLVSAGIAPEIDATVKRLLTA